MALKKKARREANEDQACVEPPQQSLCESEDDSEGDMEMLPVEEVGAAAQRERNAAGQRKKRGRLRGTSQLAQSIAS